MLKSKKLCLVLSVVLITVLGLSGCGKKGSLLESAASRDQGVPGDGIVYIEPEMVSLAASLSGNASSQEASKAAFEIANQQRAAAGLGSLTWNSGLEQACAVRAVEASQSFSHTRPDGSDWWTVNSNLMYGENLAKGYESAEAAVQAWMNSPTHKANILDAEFASGAIAIHIGSNGQWFWAQEFGY